MGVGGDLSPAWILAAARCFAPRLDTLHHVLLLQPHLVTDITWERPREEPQEMVRSTLFLHIFLYILTVLPIMFFWQMEDILALGVCVEQTKLMTVTSLQECQVFVSRAEFLQPCLERAFGQKSRSLCSRGCLQELDSIRWV